MHGGVKIDQLKEENTDAVNAGSANLIRHLENMQHAKQKNSSKRKISKTLVSRDVLNGMAICAKLQKKT